MARILEAKMDGPVIYAPSQVLSLIPRDHFVYIFSLYPDTIKVDKGSLGTFVIKGCPPGKPYGEPLRLGTVISSTYFDAMTQCMKTDDMKAEFVAQDIVKPFLGGDWSLGQNRDDFGIFWTTNEVPTELELQTARGKLEKMFRRQLQLATQLETTNRLEFITPVMRHAANYFKEDRVWNRTYRKMAECPGCGQPVNPGIIKHGCGYVYDWPEALMRGMATIEAAEMAGVDVEAIKRKIKANKAKAGKTPDADV